MRKILSTKTRDRFLLCTDDLSCLKHCGMGMIVCVVLFAMPVNVHAQQSVVVDHEIFVESDMDLEHLQQEVIAVGPELQTEILLKGDAALEETTDMLNAPQYAGQTQDERETLSERDILLINESLRRAIEQTRRLNDEKQRLDREVKALRGGQRVERLRAESMEMQLKEYQQRAEQTEQMRMEFDRTVQDLQAKIQTREQALMARIETLQKELDARAVSVPGSSVATDIVVPAAGTEKTAPDVAAKDSVLDAQQEGLDVINLLTDLDDMRRQIREDEAKIYYNMGNIFFHQGQHDQAVAEYKKALALAPEDANAHFNLAYIYGEFLHEYKPAIEHYQQYLYFSPAAPDEALVQEKILEAQLYLRAGMNIDVDHEVQKNKPTRLYTW